MRERMQEALKATGADYADIRIERAEQTSLSFRGPELDQMEADFAAFARRLSGDGSEDRLRGLADRLTSAFAPDPGRMAAAAAMPHCGAPTPV